MDNYQKRYEAHQKRKKEQLQAAITRKPTRFTKKEQDVITKLFTSRRSQRVYHGLMTGEMPYILKMMETTPSSCDRRGVSTKVIQDRADKEVLSGLLVGGVGWCNRAEYIVLLIADMKAYKNPVERPNMPYLDAGTMIQAGYLAAEAQGIGCCYINPNIREENKEFFNKRFLSEDELFCGALAFGKY